MKVWERILEKASQGERLNLEDGLLLFEADLLALGQVADSVCRKLHPTPIRAFVIDRNINYTNSCYVDCSFCAFAVKPKQKGIYVFSKAEILQKVKGLVDRGGTQVLLQGGLNAELPMEYYLDILSAIRKDFPQVDIHSFSPTEIDFFSRVYKMSVQEIFTTLKEAGLKSMPGGGAEILTERVRQIISPHKLTAARWLEIQEIAHQCGLPTTCSMVYGHVETKEERIVHLIRLREVQDRTGGFTAFIPWSMIAEGTQLTGTTQATGDEYLRMIAIARLMLDNIKNIQTGWLTEGVNLAQVALHFGANDMGGVLMEEKVVAATDSTAVVDESGPEMVRLIRQAGFQPAQRDTYYRILRTY